MNQLKDPIYYNLSQVNTYQINDQLVFVPASVEEINSQIILHQSNNYYISVVRATIPTLSIPMLIVPVTVNPSDHTDKNFSLYQIAFKVTTSPFVYNETFTVEINVPFISQFPLLENKVRTPFDNGGRQDLSNEYYWLYDIEQMILMVNNAIRTVYTSFITGFGDPNFSDAFFPYLTFDFNTRSFSIIMPANVVDGAGTHYYFDQNAPFPHFAMMMNAKLLDILDLTGSSLNNGLNTGQTNLFQLSCFNKYDNVITIVNGPTTETLYKMTASMSSLNMWQAFDKLVIAINQGISTVQEYGTVASSLPNQNIQNIANKPKISMLTDLDVDRDAWSRNRNYIQFTSSSITQQRLISITGSDLQSFTLSIYWLDNFGVQHSLSIPQGAPLTIKLGFYPKTTTLI